MLDNHRFAALGTFFVCRFRLCRFAAAIDGLGVFAVRVAGAGQKAAEAPGFNHHRLAAFFAHFFSFLLG